MKRYISKEDVEGLGIEIGDLYALILELNSLKADL